MRNNNDPDVLSQAFAEPSRRALLENLRYGRKTVTQLVEATRLKQPNVSNHLAKMRLQGIVRAERIGRQVFYSLSMPFADVMMRLLEFVANPVAEGAAALHGHGANYGGATVAIAPHAGDGEQARAADGMAGNGWHTDYIARHAEQESVSAHDAVLPDEAMMKWRSAYFDAVMEGSEEQAITLVNALLTHRVSMGTIYTDVFQWGINHIGEMFVRGETDEAHEHMASAITERMMARVVQFHTPLARTACRAILGCVAGNWHILGIRMLGDGLKELGWDTVFLGANVPTHSFVSITAAMKPDLVIVSCAMDEQGEDAHKLLTQLDTLRKNSEDGFQIVAGGHYFQEHGMDMAHLPVDFTASDLHHFLDAVKQRFPAPC